MFVLEILMYSQFNMSVVALILDWFIQEGRNEIVDAITLEWLSSCYTGWLVSWARKLGKRKCGSKEEKKD